MTKLIGYIVDIIMSFLRDIWYNVEITTAKKELEKAKEQKDELKKKSDSSTAKFKLRLKQYRTGKYADLRSTVKRVRDSSRRAGADNKDSGNRDSEAGKGNKDPR